MFHLVGWCVTEEREEAHEGRAIHRVGSDAATVIENRLQIEMQASRPVRVHADFSMEARGG